MSQGPQNFIDWDGFHFKMTDTWPGDWHSHCCTNPSCGKEWECQCEISFRKRECYDCWRQRPPAISDGGP